MKVKVIDSSTDKTNITVNIGKKENTNSPSLSVSEIDGGLMIKDEYGCDVCRIYIYDDKGDYEYDCIHPQDFVEFGEDDECGECTLCGSVCEWHWEKEWIDEGHDENGGCVGREIKSRVITEWNKQNDSSSIVKEIVGKATKDEHRSV